MATAIIPEIGSTIGKFKILAICKGKFRAVYVLAQCECGSKPTVRKLSPIKTGRVKSCGCFTIQKTKERRQHIQGQNISHHPLFRVWDHIKQRCLNPMHDHFYLYGGRGISICQEWRNSYFSFYNWAITGWKPGLQIDRKNNNGNYEPDNCQWITRKQQRFNMRCNHFVTIFGETKTLTEWFLDTRCVVKKPTLFGRINNGKDPEWSLTTPPDPKFQRISMH